MTNNQLCACLGVVGCTICFMAMGLMFFGIMPAVWGAIAGVVIAGIGLVNFN